MKRFGKSLIWLSVLALPAKWIGGSIGASAAGGKYTMPTNELYSTIVVCIIMGIIGLLIVKRANKREQKLEKEQGQRDDLDYVHDDQYPHV